MKSKYTVVAVAILTAAVGATGFAGDFTYQIVAQKGIIAPGTVAPFYSFDSQPGINNQGQVVFSATINDAFTQGIWAGAPGNLSLVAVENGAAPGIAGVQFDFFGNTPPALSLADDGRVFLTTGLKGAGVGLANDSALYVGMPGSMELLARQGSPAPGASGLNFLEVASGSFYGMWLRENGMVAFGAQLDGVASQSNDQNGYWRGTVGALQPAVMSGQSSPNGNIVQVSTGQTQAGVKQDGTMYFIASTGAGARGLWRSAAGGGVERMAVQGGSAPGTVLNFTSDPQRGFTAVEFFEPGRLWFPGTLDVPGASITNGDFYGTPDTLNLLIQSGTTAPVIGLPVNAPNHAAFNTNGDILAVVTLANGSGVTSTNNQAIFYGTSESLASWKLVMRRGNPTPVDGAVRFDFGVTADNACFNDAGTVAFYNRLAGTGVGTTNRDSIWMWNPVSEQLSMVARAGVPMDFGGGNVRKPILLTFRGGDGRPGGLTSGLNDKGQIVFEVTFSDFTEAIVIATPSPLLTVSRTVGQINISWPDTFTGYTLQQADSLVTPVSWTNATNVAIQSGGKFTATVNTVESKKYYRLNR